VRAVGFEGSHHSLGFSGNNKGKKSWPSYVSVVWFAVKCFPKQLQFHNYQRASVLVSFPTGEQGQQQLFAYAMIWLFRMQYKKSSVASSSLPAACASPCCSTGCVLC
jgi:hypothetical protein